MAYRIMNFGPTRVLPVKGVGYNLTHNQCITVEDEEVANVLNTYPMIEIVEEVPEETETEDVDEAKETSEEPTPQEPEPLKEEGIESELVGSTRRSKRKERK